LWSLGIEEQFYIVWPLCMIVVARCRKAAIGLIFVIGLISFMLNLVLVQGHRDAAFYLPFTRAWELLTGAMLAFLKFRTRIRHNVTAQLGLAMIAVVTFELHTKSTFPGWRAAISVAAAALSHRFAGSMGKPTRTRQRAASQDRPD
jgi:peptidoglycan/LPS O-acetylase OafA/YrhL